VRRCVDVLRGLVSLTPGFSPSPRCLALLVEGSACGSRGIRIVRCRETGLGLSKWLQIGANAGKLSSVIAICPRRRGCSIQNQNEYKYRCQRYSKNLRVELIELLFRQLLRFQDRISIHPRGSNKSGRAPEGTPRTATRWQICSHCTVSVTIAALGPGQNRRGRRSRASQPAAYARGAPGS
jgi:hypothetical protein